MAMALADTDYQVEHRTRKHGVGRCEHRSCKVPIRPGDKYLYVVGRGCFHFDCWRDYRRHLREGD